VSPAKLITWLLAVMVFMIALRVLQAVVGPLVATWRLGPKGQEHPIAAVPGWGDAFDSVGDCLVKGAGTTLSIEVPGTLHDLSVERAQISAPRVLREIDGDFVAEVTVTGQISPQGNRTSSYALPYHGGGLLVWLDRDNYIRLERAVILRQNNPFHYVNFEQRSSADMAASFGQGTGTGSISLRFERQGSRVTASYRAEGGDWSTFPKSMGVRGWGESLKVGIAAVNTSTAPFTAEFQDFRVGPNSN
jgi:regulation of enolase protein 1 (concanavalin A-like superfamily)